MHATRPSDPALDFYHPHSHRVATLSREEYRLETRGRDFQVWQRFATLLPAYRSGTPEYFARHAKRAEAAGDKVRARIYANEAESLRRRAMENALGQNPYTAINAAHFMAACLAAKKLPTDAERVFAQDAIEAWLPHMPKGERLECLAALRRCTPAQLGPDLATMVANYSEAGA